VYNNTRKIKNDYAAHCVNPSFANLRENNGESFLEDRAIGMNESRLTHCMSRSSRPRHRRSGSPMRATSNDKWTPLSQVSWCY